MGNLGGGCDCYLAARMKLQVSITKGLLVIRLTHLDVIHTPPQNLYLKHQLLNIEGFGDKVIRPQLQSQNFAVCLVLGCDKDNRGHWGCEGV